MDGFERALLQELFPANEAPVGGLIDAGFTGDGKSEAIAELGDGLDGIGAEVFAEEDDDVGEIRLRHMHI
jgi:hypothetical protein